MLVEAGDGTVGEYLLLGEIDFSADDDCDGNGEVDSCEIAQGEPDCDGTGLPEACLADCNDNGTPDACECQFDVDDDGEVGPFDLANLLGCWTAPTQPPPPEGACECLDADFDGAIGPFDLASLLGEWGACP